VLNWLISNCLSQNNYPRGTRFQPHEAHYYRFFATGLVFASETKKWLFFAIQRATQPVTFFDLRLKKPLFRAK
jgi:hypothetical protein